MDDETHVRTIDAHAESDGGHDDVGVLVEEGILVAAALGVGEAGVVGLGANAGLDQPRCQRIDFAPRGAVDDARLAAAAGHHVQNLPLQAGARQHAIDRGSGRSNDPTSSSGVSRPSCDAMSRRTRAVAVAV